MSAVLLLKKFTLSIPSSVSASRPDHGPSSTLNVIASVPDIFAVVFVILIPDPPVIFEVSRTV